MVTVVIIYLVGCLIAYVTFTTIAQNTFKNDSTEPPLLLIYTSLVIYTISSWLTILPLTITIFLAFDTETHQLLFKPIHFKLNLRNET